MVLPHVFAPVPHNELEVENSMHVNLTSSTVWEMHLALVHNK